MKATRKGILHPSPYAWKTSPTSSIDVRIEAGVVEASFVGYSTTSVVKFSERFEFFLQFVDVTFMKVRDVDNDYKDFFRTRYDDRFFGEYSPRAYLVLPPEPNRSRRGSARMAHFVFEAHDVAFEILGVMRREKRVYLPDP